MISRSNIDPSLEDTLNTEIVMISGRKPGKKSLVGKATAAYLIEKGIAVLDSDFNEEMLNPKPAPKKRGRKPKTEQKPAE